MATCSPLLNQLLRHTGSWRYQRVTLNVPVAATAQTLGDLDVALDKSYYRAVGVSLAPPFPGGPTENPYYIDAPLAVGIGGQKLVLDRLPWTFWRHVDVPFTERFLPVDLDPQGTVKILSELLGANATSFDVFVVFALVDQPLYERIQRLGLLQEDLVQATRALLPNPKGSLA